MRIPELLAAVVLATSGPAAATSILEGWKESLVLNYENGDSLSVNCTPKEETCFVHVTVDARSFSFGPDELGGLRVLPHRAILYAVQDGDRSTNFVFNVSVVCPEDTGVDIPPYECSAEVALVDGKPDVRVARSEQSLVGEPAPNNSFKGMPLRGTP